MSHKYFEKRFVLDSFMKASPSVCAHDHVTGNYRKPKRALYLLKRDLFQVVMCVRFPLRVLAILLRVNTTGGKKEPYTF